MYCTFFAKATWQHAVLLWVYLRILDALPVWMAAHWLYPGIACEAAFLFGLMCLKHLLTVSCNGIPSGTVRGHAYGRQNLLVVVQDLADCVLVADPLSEFAAGLAEDVNDLNRVASSSSHQSSVLSQNSMKLQAASSNKLTAAEGLRAKANVQVRACCILCCLRLVFRLS